MIGSKNMEKDLLIHWIRFFIVWIIIIGVLILGAIAITNYETKSDGAPPSKITQNDAVKQIQPRENIDVFTIDSTGKTIHLVWNNTTKNYIAVK